MSEQKNTAHNRGEYKPTRRVEDWEGTSEQQQEPKKKTETKKIEQRKKPEDRKERRREDDRDRERDRGRNDREKRTREDKSRVNLDYDKEFVDNEEKKINWVVVNSNAVQKYVNESLNLINKHKFIIVKGVAKFITTAFIVADTVGSESNKLYRINIPGTKKVKEIWWPKSKDQQKKEFVRLQPEISIELSKQPLDARHIGYQTYGQKNSEYNRNNRKRDINDRRRSDKRDSKTEKDTR